MSTRNRICPLVLPLLLLGSAATAQSRTEFCDVYGAVYLEKDRRLANVVVYVEESEAFAQLSVFRTDNVLFADRSGLWHVVDHPQLARYRVYVVDNRAFADFTVFFTDVESFAGCRQ